ncbi:MAG: hypothetical protein IPJ41_06005 [Phycisphaerales bacterium]|nr:hypothetical protein [Phycisphaerales bacterium]
MTRRGLALGACGVLVCGILAAAAGAQGAASPGSAPGEIGGAGAQVSPAMAIHDTGAIVFHDGRRDKDLAVRIRYPEATAGRPGPFPLVVFSHGAGGSCDAFASLSETLASHGYVVIHPTHSDSVSLTPKSERRSRGAELLRDPKTILRDVNLPDRVADVRFILDNLDEIETRLDEAHLIDRDRMAMAGHSAGAMTTQALGGLRFYAGRRALGDALHEPRFSAFAVISGQGVNGRAVTEDSWAEIRSPWLVITGSKDVSAVSDETPESRRDPFEYAPADGTKYLLFIDGATHSSYQGKGPGPRLDGRAPANVDWIGATTNAAVLEFFDAYVRGDEAARAKLDDAEFADPEGGRLEFRHK